MIKKGTNKKEVRELHNWGEGSLKTIQEPYQVPPAEPELNLLTLHYRAGGHGGRYVYVS